MDTTKKGDIGVRIGLVLLPDLHERIVDHRYTDRHPTLTAAIEDLLQRGLAQAERNSSAS